MKYVIFSIDKESDPFYRGLLQGLFASEKAKGKLVPMLCCYEGITEHSWCCLAEDFAEFVLDTDLIANQESIMRVSECNKQYAELEFLGNNGYAKGSIHPIGSLKAVSAYVAKAERNWTYRPDTGQYFIAVKENPDTIPPMAGWLSTEQHAAIQQCINVLRVRMTVHEAQYGRVGSWHTYNDAVEVLKAAFKEETLH